MGELLTSAGESLRARGFHSGREGLLRVALRPPGVGKAAGLPPFAFLCLPFCFGFGHPGRTRTVLPRFPPEPSRQIRQRACFFGGKSGRFLFRRCGRSPREKGRRRTGRRDKTRVLRRDLRRLVSLGSPLVAFPLRPLFGRLPLRFRRNSGLRQIPGGRAGVRRWTRTRTRPRVRSRAGVRR